MKGLSSFRHSRKYVPANWNARSWDWLEYQAAANVFRIFCSALVVDEFEGNLAVRLNLLPVRRLKGTRDNSSGFQQVRNPHPEHVANVKLPLDRKGGSNAMLD